MRILITILISLAFSFGQDWQTLDGRREFNANIMNYITNGGDASLAISTGKVSGISCASIYGHANAGVQTTTTDIWDLADATPTQSVWLAPTAARVHAIVSTSAEDVSAMGILTFTANAEDTETVTIGTKVYTFQATLTDVDGNVKIGASASATIDNLIDAINLGETAGTDYAESMTANDIDMIATVEEGDLMNLYVNTASDTIATEDDNDHMSWGDTDAVLGVGARTIRIWGLKTWDSDETTEDIYLRGVWPQNTANSYVMINKMEVLTKGATSVNTGAITATAATDATITANISAGIGKTTMAIYGVPSTKTAYMTSDYASFNKTGAAGNYSIMRLLVNPEPDVEPVNFIIDHRFTVQSNGASYVEHPHSCYHKIEGPALIKLNGIANAADTDVSGGFDLILVDD